MKLLKAYRYLKFRNNTFCRVSLYVQGQSPEPNSREYFYFVDHQGMLFMDDAKMKNFTSCFKEKKFLQFFFSRLRMNKSGRYAEFPFLSPCGKERNFVRCEDKPIVFTHILEVSGKDYISYGHAGDLLKVEFEPEKLCMMPRSGRLYHPGPLSVGGVGLVKSSLAIELSQSFEYSPAHDNNNQSPDMPVCFWWKGEEYTLTNEILQILKTLKRTIDMP